MIKLNQHESNVIYWSKHWYGDKMAENFWKELKALCDKGYLMDCGLRDMYSIVRTLWAKILNEVPNKEYLWDEYENDTLPSKARYYRGSPNYGSTNWHCDDSFDEKQMLQARVAKMISQLGCTQVKYYEAMLPQDVGDLKVKNREKLEEMMNKCQTPEP